MKRTIFLFLILFSTLSANYDPKYENFSEKSGIDTAILITAYNRPEYFQKVLEAIAQNPESEEIAIFIFVDGGPNAKQQEHIEIFSSFRFPHGYLIAHEENLGCEKNVIDSRRFMFDHCGFERVIIMEDDHVISPDGIALLLRMHEWGKRNIEGFGAVTLWSDRKLSQEEKINHLTVLTEPYRRKMKASKQGQEYYILPLYWVFCIDKEVWDEIKEMQYEYEKRFILTPKFDRKLNPQIYRWEREKLLQAKELYDRTDPARSKILGNPISIPLVPFQDGVTEVSLREKGRRYVIPAVNRMENIGVYGLHFNPGLWKRLCGGLRLDLFDEDHNLSTFRFLEGKGWELPQ